METVFALYCFYQNPRQDVLAPQQKYQILFRIMTGVKAAYEMKNPHYEIASMCDQCDL